MGEIHPKLWRTQAQTARITGVPSRTIESWVKNRTIETNATKVDVIEVFQREVDRKKAEIEQVRKKIDTSENPQVRLTLAQCEKLETETELKKLELGKIKGELMAIADVERDLTSVLFTTRSKFLSLPSLAPQLAEISDPRAIADLLKRFADQTLEELRFEYLAIGESDPEETEETIEAD
jgi:hypothetical protein